MSHDPFSQALLSADWTKLATEAAMMGRHYWDRSSLWTSATLLLQSGHGDVLVRLYDHAKPLIKSGEIDVDLVAIPATVVAMRNAGRGPEADQLLARYTSSNAKLPDQGLGGTFKRINLAQISAVSGRNEEALRMLDRVSREAPLVLLPIPALSLFNNPYYQGLKADPRLLQTDERLRAALNVERGKAGLLPVSRKAWLSDPKTLLTIN